MNRQEIIDKILQERERQHDLPGSEFDPRNGPNDWIAIAGHYLFEDARRNGMTPESEEYKDSLIKAAAVILAALEHSDHMAEKQWLNKEKGDESI